MDTVFSQVHHSLSNTNCMNVLWWGFCSGVDTADQRTEEQWVDLLTCTPLILLTTQHQQEQFWVSLSLTHTHIHTHSTHTHIHILLFYLRPQFQINIHKDTNLADALVAQTFKHLTQTFELAVMKQRHNKSPGETQHSTPHMGTDGRLWMRWDCFSFIS